MTEDTLPLDTRGTRPAFFADPDLDAMMTALLETMGQLWATRDYARALEKLLVEKGVIEAGELDRVEWSAAEYAEFQGAGRRTREIDDVEPGAQT